MGSSYFYLEVLLVWLSLLKAAGFKNPAIFALEYSLVPDQSFPVQLHQAIAGYNYITSLVHDTSEICVAGDSAGATLVLTLLLHLGRRDGNMPTNGMAVGRNENLRPGMAVLISPWVTLLSTKDEDTARDYLNLSTLHLYAYQYANNKISLHDPQISPGNCKDVSWWQRSSPSGGFFISYGSEEVFAPEIRDLVTLWKDAGMSVESREERGGIHAWSIAAVFLSRTYISF